MGFLDGSEDEKEYRNSSVLNVNKKFAAKYEEGKKKLELARLKELEDSVGSEGLDSETEESEDENAEQLTTGLDLEIIRTINRIRSKAPEIYDSSKRFFKTSDSSHDGSGDSSADQSDSNERNKDSLKPMKFKDVVRSQVLSANDAEDMISSEDEDPDVNKRDLNTLNKSTLAYDEEQKLLRSSFLVSLGSHDDESKKGITQEGKNDEEHSDEDDFLKVRVKSAEEKDMEEKLLKEEVEKLDFGLGNDNEADSFLKDFITNKRWKEKVVDEQPFYDEIVDEKCQLMSDSEDEKELDKQDAFEAKYNFRFEEEGGSNIANYSREIVGSLRRKDDKRIKDREIRKIKKSEERKAKELELRRLKNLKREEIQRRLKAIEELSGGGVVDEDAIEEDFDSEKWDLQMSKTFGDSYYMAEDSWKPVETQEDEEDEENGYDEKDYAEETDEWAGAENEEVIDSKEKLIDELYKLDYEDIIEDIPCRFKYRTVEKEDFGLSTEEILLADDRELNRFVSLKKIAPYREDKIKINTKQRQRLRQQLKLARKEAEAEAEAELSKKSSRRRKKAQAMKAAMAVVDEKSQNIAENSESVPKVDITEGSQKKRKRNRNHARKGQKDEVELVPKVQPISDKVESAGIQNKSNFEKKNKKKRKSKGTVPPDGVEASRLASYGIM